MDESGSPSQICFADRGCGTRSAGNFRGRDAGRSPRDPIEGLVAGEIVEREKRVARRSLRRARAGGEKEDAEEKIAPYGRGSVSRQYHIVAVLSRDRRER